MIKAATLSGIATGFLLSLVATGPSTAADAPLRIRTYLHDPVKPTAELYVEEPSGSVGRLQLTVGNFSIGQDVQPRHGSFFLYRDAFEEPSEAEPMAICSAKVPAGSKSAIVVIVGMPPGTHPAYKMVILDDSPSSFPNGESRVLSLVPVESAIEIGEHKLPLEAGKVRKVPPVKRRNEFNMAQTNFSYRNDDRWIPFVERQMQYLEEYRRIFIVHVTPGAVVPTVTSIVDIMSSPVPGKRN